MTFLVKQPDWCLWLCVAFIFGFRYMKWSNALARVEESWNCLGGNTISDRDGMHFELVPDYIFLCFWKALCEKSECCFFRSARSWSCRITLGNQLGNDCLYEPETVKRFAEISFGSHSWVLTLWRSEADINSWWNLISYRYPERSIAPKNPPGARSEKHPWSMTVLRWPSKWEKSKCTRKRNGLSHWKGSLVEQHSVGHCFCSLVKQFKSWRWVGWGLVVCLLYNIDFGRTCVVQKYDFVKRTLFPNATYG